MSEDAEVGARYTESLTESDDEGALVVNELPPEEEEAAQELPTTPNPPAEDEAPQPEQEEDPEEEEVKPCKTTASGPSARGVTLQMLLADRIIRPEKDSMSLEYMGRKFVGDLLIDGRIWSSEARETFGSPSAWALRCKKMASAQSKSGLAWSSLSSKRSVFDVRYCGHPLDVYKNRWMEKRQAEQADGAPGVDEVPPTSTGAVGSTSAPSTGSGSGGSSSGGSSGGGGGGAVKASASSGVGADEPSLKLIPGQVAVIVKHESLPNRLDVEDANVLVELTSFAESGKLQPFLVTLHTSALIVMDVHCSLTTSEVVGYLAGSWDLNTNTLTVRRCYPGLSRLADGRRGAACEALLASEMERQGLVLVGWYHSHPLSPPTPSVLDVDAQLDYQLKLKGPGGELGYRPCLGIICSPYHRDSAEPEPATPPMCCYWAAPPPESRPQEVARPMSMQYTVAVDACVEHDVLAQIESTVKFYKDLPDHICFDAMWMAEATVLDKLKASLASQLRDAADGDAASTQLVTDLLDDLLGPDDQPPTSKKLRSTSTDGTGATDAELAVVDDRIGGAPGHVDATISCM